MAFKNGTPFSIIKIYGEFLYMAYSYGVLVWAAQDGISAFVRRLHGNLHGNGKNDQELTLPDRTSPVEIAFPDSTIVISNRSNVFYV